MGAKTLISVEEYLRTPYDNPEPDFVDGEVVPRTLPNTFHSRALSALFQVFFLQTRGVLSLYPELRIQVTPERYRIVDLAVFDREPQMSVPELPPLIVIEVLSPDDSYAELMRRFADYAAIGIPHIWLVDPIDKQLSIYHDKSLTASARLEVPAFGVSICPADIWS